MQQDSGSEMKQKHTQSKDKQERKSLTSKRCFVHQFFLLVFWGLRSFLSHKKTIGLLAVFAHRFPTRENTPELCTLLSLNEKFLCKKTVRHHLQKMEQYSEKETHAQNFLEWDCSSAENNLFLCCFWQQEPLYPFHIPSIKSPSLLFLHFQMKNSSCHSSVQDSNDGALLFIVSYCPFFGVSDTFIARENNRLNWKQKHLSCPMNFVFLEGGGD